MGYGYTISQDFKKLHDKVKHLKNCIFYTDSWDTFSKVLLKERHIISKQYTVAIERDNSSIRNDLARFTRRIKVVSKSLDMINPVAIERDNSSIRNDLARFTRRIKVVSKSLDMINPTLKLWQAFHTSSLFDHLQSAFLPVFL